MSFEGYVQRICENGHYGEADVLYADLDVCEDCDTDKFPWINLVDQTNEPAEGVIPFDVLKEKFLLKEREAKACPSCGHEKIVSEAVFRIPTHEETDPLREDIFCDEEGNFRFRK